MSLEFELIGVVHHGNFLLGEIGGDTSDQLVDGSFGIFESSLSGQPPRGLGSEQDTDEDRDRPDPLDGERDLVSPLGLVVDQSSVNTGDQPVQTRVWRKCTHPDARICPITQHRLT